MDFLDSVVKKMEETKLDLGLQDDKENEATSLSVVTLSPDVIDNWEYRDRQDCDLGNIDDLARSIQLKGQAQPIIVVKPNDIFKPRNNQEAQYILVAGYRRWLACKSIDIKIEAIIREMDFDQAIGCLIAENEKEGVSDYSKGIFFYNLLKKEGVKNQTLYERLGFKRTAFENFLSFAEVPREVWDAVGNLTKISARTSATIKQICAKGRMETNAIISIADKISDGIGEKKIKALVNKVINGYDKNKNATRVAFSDDLALDITSHSLKVGIKNLSDEKVTALIDKISFVLKDFVEVKER